MEDQTEAAFDWVNLPAGVKEESLWDCLHDAKLKSIASDRLERTVRIEFDIPHLRTFHGLPYGITFVLRLNGVQSGRILLDIPWSGESPIPDGLSYEASEKLRAFYFTKWRQDSGSWSDFETAITGGKNMAEVGHAAYAVCEDGRFALKLELRVDDETYPELFLRSEALEIHTNDGNPLSLAQFLRLGESYWEAFAARRSASNNSDADRPAE